MNIIETKHNWNGSLARRNSTKYIVLHHRAGNGTVESIHAQHLTQGWSGIGYHFYVRKDGSIYRGRPVEMVGAHCQGHNNYSVGVCFEGNFENEHMSSAQLKAGKELVAYLKGLYSTAEIKKHKDFGGTSCPGKNFPFAELQNVEYKMTVDEAVKIIKTKVGLEDQTIKYLLNYKYGEALVTKLAKAIK